MSHFTPSSDRSTHSTNRPIPFPFRKRLLVGLLLIVPLAAHAQGSPFDTGFTSLQTLFTGTVAKVASLIAIVIGGYGFAHGGPGAKKALAGVAAGTGIAAMAANVPEKIEASITSLPPISQSTERWSTICFPKVLSRWIPTRTQSPENTLCPSAFPSESELLLKKANLRIRVTSSVDS